MTVSTDGRNHAVDIMRIVASFFVLICHIPFPDPAALYTKAAARFAVPFFLMVTGWYLYRENDQDALKTARKFFFSAVRFTLFSLAFVCVMNVLNYIIMGLPPFGWLTDETSGLGSPEIRSEFLLHNYTLFLSPVLWYLFGLVYALAVYLLLVRFRLVRFAAWLILPLIGLNLYRGEWVGEPWYHQATWLFMSLPFLLAGGFLKAKGICRKVPALLSWLMIPAGILFTLVLEVPHFGTQILYAGTLPVVFGIFTLCMNRPAGSRPGVLADFGRSCTPVIFVIHPSLDVFLKAVFPMPAAAWWGWAEPFLLFFLCSALAFVWVRCGRAVRRRFLRQA